MLSKIDFIKLIRNLTNSNRINVGLVESKAIADLVFEQNFSEVEMVNIAYNVAQTAVAMVKAGEHHTTPFARMTWRIEGGSLIGTYNHPTDMPIPTSFMFMHDEPRVKRPRINRAVKAEKNS